MATPSVLTFDAEGRAVDFEVWVDDLQLFLQCDRADGLSLLDLTSGASPAPPATADSTVRSQWATRDAAARLAVRRHLPTTERAHFSHSGYGPLGSTDSSEGGAESEWEAEALKDPVLQRFGFTWSSAQATPLAIGHSLSALPSDESVDPSGPYPELVGCLITSGMGLVLGGRRSVVLTGHSNASWVDDQATQRSSQGYTFSLGSAMAAQELRWLTYLLTDLGERPSSPPVLYVDNKAAIALCQGHRLEHRTKHITLRYFLARELQQRGQLCLCYVATRANTADIFTKALVPGDHQRFCTVLGLVPTVPHLL
ncbi:unnamed protein product [Closterium sp. NIES-53]